MSMTEKQGGSDVRTNSTVAAALDPSRRESGDLFALTGHKWFTSAPMSDGFFTLAYTDHGLTCFLVPRWLDGNLRSPFSTPVPPLPLPPPPQSPPQTIMTFSCIYHLLPHHPCLSNPDRNAKVSEMRGCSFLG